MIWIWIVIIIGKIKMNKDETFEQQQKQGRRPRFSIIKSIIEKQGLEPIVKVDLKSKEITRID